MASKLSTKDCSHVLHRHPGKRTAVTMETEDGETPPPKKKRQRNSSGTQADSTLQTAESVAGNSLLAECVGGADEGVGVAEGESTAKPKKKKKRKSASTNNEVEVKDQRSEFDVTPIEDESPLLVQG